MDEILYELRDHVAGLNAGRWDYIFSFVKKFRLRPDLVLPDRSSVTMTVPFMRAYTELMVKTCHRRGAHAIGGMSAFIPNRRDPAVTEAALAKVREDKVREAADGCDGTWVAHPDLVPVAAEIFDRVLGNRPNQLECRRDDVNVTAADLVRIDAPGQGVTESGLRTNVSVGIQYLESWLRGNGAAAINNLMEDTATAEICRAQVWQWRHHEVRLEGGPVVTPDLVAAVMEEEMAKLRGAIGPPAFDARPFATARDIFARAALEEPFHEFLTHVSRTSDQQEAGSADHR
jgi:malate synthase